MLFTPHRLGALTLPNRIVMPPMTRSRSSAGNVPTAEMATYYAQRAGAGLIVSEGTQISAQGQVTRGLRASTARNRCRAGAR